MSYDRFCMYWWEEYKDITRYKDFWFDTCNNLEECYVKITRSRGQNCTLRWYYYVRISQDKFQRVYPRYGNVYRLKDSKDIRMISEIQARELYPERFI